MKGSVSSAPSRRGGVSPAVLPRGEDGSPEPAALTEDSARTVSQQLGPSWGLPGSWEVAWPTPGHDLCRLKHCESLIPQVTGRVTRGQNTHHIATHQGTHWVQLLPHTSTLSWCRHKTWQRIQPELPGTDYGTVATQSPCGACRSPAVQSTSMVLTLTV